MAATSVRTSAASPPELGVNPVMPLVMEAGETFDTGVCKMAFFRDPDGNDLMLHGRYAPREGGGA